MTGSSTPQVAEVLEHQLAAKLDRNRLPRHVAVLADGNRRWARLNAPGSMLAVGYQAGADKIRDFVGWCDEVGLSIVTLWVLSTDNLRRAPEELVPLLEVIENLFFDLASTGRWRVQAVGDMSLLPPAMAANLSAAREGTKDIDGMLVNIAVAYGGRRELRDAFQSLLREKAATGDSLEQIADGLEIDQISEHLYTKGQPEPDLIIRTSGEHRLSGFLLWQSVHSEFFFCDALWPDFCKADILQALCSFSERERRYGR